MLLALLLLIAPPDDGVPELVRQLGHDDAVMRAAAVEKLLGRGRAIVPELESALVGQSDLEVRARISMLLRQLTQVRWLTDVHTARQRAAKEKKPLLVFSTLGPLDGFV